MKTVRYLGPSPENHGHCVVKKGESPRLTRCILTKASNPPTEGEWFALERDLLNLLDGLTLRRRLREKTTNKHVQCLHQEQKNEEEERIVRMKRIVEEETVKMVDDPPHLAILAMQVVAKLKRGLEVKEGDEEEVIQTRIVSPKEVLESWNTGINGVHEEEVSLLIFEKQALKPIPKDERVKMIDEARKKGLRIEIIPSKLVWTKKPGKKGGRKKVRWVVCGNFESKDPNEETFSPGADAAAFRIMVWTASKFQWEASALDVKTAFLNAKMAAKEDQELILILPPASFVERGFLDRDTYYQPLKAVYGFRRSPRLWGEHRDETLQRFTIEVEEEEEERKDGEEMKKTLQLFPLASEPNLWKAMDLEFEGVEGELYGLVMTYVDDIFVNGSKRVVQAILKGIQDTWVTSSLEHISAKA